MVFYFQKHVSSWIIPSQYNLISLRVIQFLKNLFLLPKSTSELPSLVLGRFAFKQRSPLGLRGILGLVASLHAGQDGGLLRAAGSPLLRRNASPVGQSQWPGKLTPRN